MAHKGKEGGGRREVKTGQLKSRGGCRRENKGSKEIEIDTIINPFSPNRRWARERLEPRVKG